MLQFKATYAILQQKEGIVNSSKLVHNKQKPPDCTPEVFNFFAAKSHQG